MATKPVTAKSGTNQSIQAGRMNVYVDGKFRAQLNDDAAYEYAHKEMAKGGEVIVTRRQWDLSELS